MNNKKSIVVNAEVMRDIKSQKLSTLDASRLLASKKLDKTVALNVNRATENKNNKETTIDKTIASSSLDSLSTRIAKIRSTRNVTQNISEDDILNSDLKANEKAYRVRRYMKNSDNTVNSTTRYHATQEDYDNNVNAVALTRDIALKQITSHIASHSEQSDFTHATCHSEIYCGASKGDISRAILEKLCSLKILSLDQENYKITNRKRYKLIDLKKLQELVNSLK